MNSIFLLSISLFLLLKFFSYFQCIFIYVKINIYSLIEALIIVINYKVLTI